MRETEIEENQQNEDEKKLIEEEELRNCEKRMILNQLLEKNIDLQKEGD